MQNKSILILSVFVLCFFNALGQKNISGKIINKENNLPVEYVNIGIPGKEIGTVSDAQGNYHLQIPNENLNDTLLVSSIGYNSLKIRTRDIIEANNQNIFLTERIFELQDVVVKPKIFKTKILGVENGNKSMTAGFSDNKLGYELGLLMKVKKSAFLKKVNVKIAYCGYDTVFYRLNVYEGGLKEGFENIMREPFYIKIPKSQVKDKITVDIEKLNIVAHKNFLVTLEHVKDLGKGNLWFPFALFSKTYHRKTSQGKWETTPIGIALSVEADVEQ